MQRTDGQEGTADLVAEEAEEARQPIQEDREVPFVAHIRRMARLKRRAVVAQCQNSIATRQQFAREAAHRGEIRAFGRQCDPFDEPGACQQAAGMHGPPRQPLRMLVQAGPALRQRPGQRPGHGKFQQSAAIAEPKRVIVVIAEIGATRVCVGSARNQAGIDLKTGLLQQARGVETETVTSCLVGGGP